MSKIMPTVHLNGTGRKMLTDGYLAAHDAVQNAIEKLAGVEFHARDYYVHADPDAYTKARAERDEQFAKLESVRADIQAILEHLS
jgi:hypothetical protein